MIDKPTNKTLHDLAGEQVLAHFVRPGLNAADLGSRPATMADSELTIVSPIFCNLLQPHFLPCAGRRLGQQLLFPADGFQLHRETVGWSMRLASRISSRGSALAENHIFVLEVAS